MAETGRNWFLTTVSVPRGWSLVFGGSQINLDAIDWPRIDSWNWSDIRVAHMDHGYTQHPVTKGIVRPDQGKNFMEPGNADPRDPMDYPQEFGVHGHCTRTGSVLAGKDKQEQYIGTAPGVPLIPYRVTNRSVLNIRDGTLDEPECTHIAKAMQAAFTKGCQVISISLGSLLGWRVMGEAVDEAYERGIIVVAAAGQVIEEVVYPGKYPQTICVAGIKPQNWPYATYRKSAAFPPDIWAPGAHVWRAQAELPDDGINSYGYDYGDGTSYATAMIAGLAALFLRKFGPELDQHYPGWKRVELFRRLLRRGSKRVRGDVQDGIIVEFPLVLIDPSPVFPWPRTDELRHTPGKAADMRL